MVTEEKLQATVDRLSALPLVRKILARLARELPPTLTYHSFAHTQDVVRDSVLFALMDNLTPRDMELLVIAAAMHDAGFLEKRSGNEPIGARIAREAMVASGGYTEDEIRLVEQMILDTAVVMHNGAPKQIPSTELSKYLLDADLGNFGRDDFFAKGELQRVESGDEIAPFRIKTLALINAHVWNTNAARTLRQAKRDENLATLKAMIAAGK